MKQSTLLLCLTLAVLASCAKRESALLPSGLSVLNPSGITARESWKKDAVKIGAVQSGKTYPVRQGLAGSVRIRLADSTTGWISAGQDASWIALLPGSKVRILREGGISVRETPFDTESPVVAAVSAGKEFPVLEVRYTHFLVGLTEGGEGWIFAGRPEDPWVRIK